MTESCRGGHVRRAMRWRWARCTAAAAAVAAAGPVAAQDVIQRVPVSLNNPLPLSTSLPFDERFVFVGKAARELDSLRAFYRPLRRANAEADVFGAGCATRDVVGDSTRAQMTRPWAQVNTAQADSFQLDVPGIEPNRVYVFCFRLVSRLDSARLADFRQSVARNLASALRTLAARHPREVPGTELPAIGESIRAAVPRGGLTVQAPPGSIFAPAGDTATVRGLLAFLPLTSGRGDALVNIPGARDRAAAALQRLGAHPALGRLLAAFYATQPDTLGAPLAPAAGLGTVLVGLATSAAPAAPAAAPSGPPAACATSALCNAAEGLAVLGTDAGIPLATLASDLQGWDPVPVEARLATLARSEAALAQFRVLAVRALVDPALRRAGGPDTAGARALLAATDGATQALGAVENRLALLRDALAAFQRGVDGAAAALTPRAASDVQLVGTTIGTFEARAKAYVSADLGLAYAGPLRRVLPYVGANFYFRPVNKRVPLQCGCLTRRLALTVGLTPVSVAREGVRENLFGSQSALAGIGVRVTDAVRASVGTLLFRRLDPDPAVDHPTVRGVGFAALSFDWDVKGVLGKVGDALFQ